MSITAGRVVEGAIDLHAHAVLDATFETAGAYGPELGEDAGSTFFRVGSYTLKPISYPGSVFMVVERRLDEMAQARISLQMLSPNPLTFFAGIEAELATRFAQVSNDAMAALVREHPGKLLGSAQLPVQDVKAAIAELERALELGLVAAYIGTNYPTPLDDPGLDPLYTALVANDVPLFIHPATNDGKNAAADTRLHRFGLDLIVGYTYEETVTAATMILGGVFDRHPDLDVCISHGGGAVAYLVERFHSMAKRRGTPTDFGDLLSQFWFDAHMEPGPARSLVMDAVGVDRLVYGTNFGGWDTPETADEWDISLNGNARRLLRLQD
ncbi:MAG: amidohydrolase family protein [Acidimicrobiales bacterium]